MNEAQSNRSKPTARVFLSYASEDLPEAEELHRRLRRAGFKPWLDRKDLVPGQHWKLEIRRAIREADVVLVLLSDFSVMKRGYVQREIVEALDIWKEKLENDIYLIPVRLDQCEPPPRLREFHWVDLFTADGQKKLEEAIREAVRTRSPDPAAEDLSVTEVVLNDRRDDNPRYVAKVTFPRFETKPMSVEVERINAILSKSASSHFEQFARPDQEPHPEVGVLSAMASELEISWTCSLRTRRVLSVRLNIYVYGAGAAHGSMEFEHYNYLLSSLREVTLVNLMGGQGRSLDFIRDWARTDLTGQFADDGYQVREVDLDRIESGISDPASIGFSLTESELVLFWREYEVGPYSWGPRQVAIPYKALMAVSEGGYLPEVIDSLPRGDT